MASTFSYRPKRYSVNELKKFAQQRNTNLNRLIEETLIEKIQDVEMAEKKGPAEELARKITKVVVEHMGVRLIRPDEKTHARILRKAKAGNAKKSWIVDEKARPEKFS